MGEDHGLMVNGKIEPQTDFGIPSGCLHVLHSIMKC